MAETKVDSLVSPLRTLESLADRHKVAVVDPKFAEILNELDELKHLRAEFCYPKNKELPFGKNSNRKMMRFI